VPDECEDCDGNGIADECDLNIHFAASSPQLSPFGLGSNGLHTFVNPPPRLTDVTLTFEASADLASTFKSVLVFLADNVNGGEVQLAEIFRFNGTTCPTTPDMTVLTVPRATFDAAVGDGDAMFRMRADSSDPEQCATTWIRVAMEYDGVSSLDSNNNGLIDLCECDADCAAAGPDTLVSVSDLLSLLAGWGPGANACDIAPPGGDGQINVSDLLALLAAWGTCAP